MKPKIIAGNWKMNLDGDSAQSLVEGILSAMPEAKQTSVIIHPPFPMLDKINSMLEGHKTIHLGAQNIYPEDNGAFTGEVSGPMLENCGVSHVIVGHSERRAYFSETNSFICLKAKYCLSHHLTPIICIGESLEVREAGKHFEHVIGELNEATEGFSEEDIQNSVIAYEPIWAIGTGKTATPEQAQEMHYRLRSILKERFGSIAHKVPILYGGSMKPANAKELLSCEDIDGGLIGGASLKAEDFIQLVKIAEGI